MGQWKDRLGILASAACAIHCAATPFLVACLPTLKLTAWMAGPAFHQTVAVVCSLLVAIAIWPAFLRNRDYRILTLSSMGLALILSAAFLLEEDRCSTSLAVLDAGVDGHVHTHSSADAPQTHSHDHSDHGHEDTLQHSETLFAGWLPSSHWLTPLGGFLLIAAHGLNMRRRWSVCGTCCSNEVSEDYSRTESILAGAVVSKSVEEFAQAS
jgi:hypothetical protein